MRATSLFGSNEATLWLCSLLNHCSRPSFFLRLNNIVTSAVTADLASHPSIRGNNKSLETAIGIINGCSSVMASVGLLAIGPLQDAYGWDYVWYLLFLCAFTCTTLLSPKIYSELFPPLASDEHTGIQV